MPTLAELLQGGAPAAYGNPMLMRQGAAGFGQREDGSQKGYGFMGKLPRPDGGFSTELSFDFGADGKNISAPLLVPTLSRPEIDHLLGGGQPTPDIYTKAQQHALERIKAGQSPFAQHGEMNPTPQAGNNTLSSLLGVVAGNAQAADAWKPNAGVRGGQETNVTSGSAGAPVASAAPDIRQIQMARQELQALGPPQMWHPSQVAANTARMQQLQAIIKGQLR